jgi:hypothetical protein
VFQANITDEFKMVRQDAVVETLVEGETGSDGKGGPEYSAEVDLSELGAGSDSTGSQQNVVHNSNARKTSKDSGGEKSHPLHSENLGESDVFELSGRELPIAETGNMDIAISESKNPDTNG